MLVSGRVRFFSSHCSFFLKQRLATLWQFPPPFIAIFRWTKGLWLLQRGEEVNLRLNTVSWGYQNLMWPDGSQFQKISESGDKTNFMPKLEADSVFSLPHGPENGNYGEKKESKLSMGLLIRRGTLINTWPWTLDVQELWASSVLTSDRPVWSSKGPPQKKVPRWPETSGSNQLRCQNWKVFPV